MYNFFVYLAFSFLVITISLFAFLGLVPLGWAVFFLVLTSFVFFLFYFLYKELILQNNKGNETLKEKINLLNNLIEKKKEVIKYLPLKKEKAAFLVDLSQELVELDNPEDIYSFLLLATKQLFPGFSFISLFEFDRETHLLKLKQSLKQKNMPIKEKQGSGIELWMLRQNSSILIGDIRKDFRFDASRIKGYTERNSISFLCSPLSVGSNFFGIIRIENSTENFFSHEDLRFLSNICDLGAVVLERASLLQRVKKLAVTDSLTELSLRNYFFEKAESEIYRAGENGSQLGLIMLDIDNFKAINDTHGHTVGDLALKKIASLLKVLEAEGKILACRYGGEEFLLLALETDKSKALALAEFIRKKIETLTIVYRRTKVNFTVSGGLAIYPDDKSSRQELFELADKFLYKAKNEGKNKICYS